LLRHSFQYLRRNFRRKLLKDRGGALSRLRFQDANDFRYRTGIQQARGVGWIKLKKTLE
jgi:hypothetical protein